MTTATIQASETLASFFSAVAQIASDRVAAKKAKHAAKKQANLRVLGRAQFKKSGAILIGIEDRNGKEPVVMHVTINSKGKVTSCLNPETGEACDARYWSGHCCHGDRALQYEAARTDVQSSAEEHDMIEPEQQLAATILGEQFAQDIEPHVVDSIESGEGDWIDQQRAAWAKMTPEQKREAQCNTFGLYDYDAYSVA